jgi:hypothetical protein
MNLGERLVPLTIGSLVFSQLPGHEDNQGRGRSMFCRSNYWACDFEAFTPVDDLPRIAQEATEAEILVSRGRSISAPH